MPQLLKQDSITDNTKMVVVSGLQLKAKWGKQFKQHQTKQGIFHPLDTQKVKRVPFMQKRGVFNYHEDETVKVLGIPTQGHELTMFVILPKHKDGLTQVEKEELVEGNELKRLLDNCEHKKRQVNVQLPKFQIKHKLDAKQALLKKGIVNMFDTKTADFSGITGHPNTGILGQYENVNVNVDKRTQIHVNKFLHQATIKVTDQGITSVGPQDIPQEMYEPEEYSTQQGQYEQYGQYENEEEQDIYGEYETQFSTGRDRFEQIMGLNTLGKTKKQFKANHPFVFVVRHNPTKQILLMGRVIDAGLKPTPVQTMQEIYPTQGIY
jgi:serine protease inhibitor